MKKEEMEKNIIKLILELERKNIHSGFKMTRDQMIDAIEKIIIEGVEKYENSKIEA
ncbi:TPA: hypothetical protein ACGSMF_004032 [Bacillus cereus]